ncbi:OB-fold domain-containing protein [Shewanella corallii]|uniref:OB-fold domain-containing protein n=1 Tax=Shewanella corallii TaxID=560080 RepID=A0ABT0NAM1_9GAMM|nr:OB-fold domain-containing protein [Shewanella corallii]MCL2915506.1 OB-fold domain-containing protein [Shewanella corallii]
MSKDWIDDKVLGLDDEGIYLRASQCPNCSQICFPPELQCNRCDLQTELLPLSREGVLWSWTTQAYPPKAPPFADQQLIENFSPFLLGFVELPEGIRVITRLQNVHTPEIGIPVKLTPLDITLAPNKQARQAFAFVPI